MMAGLPRMPVDPRAAELIEALQARCAARVAVSELLAQMEDHLARQAPVPPPLLSEFEARAARFAQWQERVRALARLT